MTIALAILFALALGVAIFLLLKNKKLEDAVSRINNWAQTSLADAQKSADERIAAVQQEAQASVAEAWIPFRG